MRRMYVTFSGSNYDETTRRIVDDAPKFGADEVRVYDDEWLTEQPFRQLNAWLWDHPHKRGFGWYAWKPFIILDALSKAQDGDVVLFTDADTYPVHDLTALFEICARDGAMLFEASAWMNRQWCKRDCYVILAQDEAKYHDSKAGVARFMLFQKGPWKPYQFLIEWFTYCVNPLATTFDPSILKEELSGFREHRTEQAILTLLAHKYGYKLHREACEAGAGAPNDWELFPVLFHQRNMSDVPGATKTTAKNLGSKYRNV